MADWDEESPQLSANLTKVLRRIRDEARKRVVPNAATAREWHREIMRGLTVPKEAAVGRFRGGKGLERVEVWIGTSCGVSASDVSRELFEFEKKLKAIVARLDELIPVGGEIDADQLSAVIDVCAWVHAEWVRIHPFANGNGRTARLWANCIAMRYGIPPFVRLRPRPDGEYGKAGERAMDGDWNATSEVFHQMLEEFRRELGR